MFKTQLLISAPLQSFPPPGSQPPRSPCQAAAPTHGSLLGCPQVPSRGAGSVLAHTHAPYTGAPHSSAYPCARTAARWRTHPQRAKHCRIHCCLRGPGHATGFPSKALLAAPPRPAPPRLSNTPIRHSVCCKVPRHQIGSAPLHAPLDSVDLDLWQRGPTIARLAASLFPEPAVLLRLPRLPVCPLSTGSFCSLRCARALPPCWVQTFPAATHNGPWPVSDQHRTRVPTAATAAIASCAAQGRGRQSHIPPPVHRALGHRRTGQGQGPPEVPRGQGCRFRSWCPGHGSCSVNVRATGCGLGESGPLAVGLT